MARTDIINNQRTPTNYARSTTADDFAYQQQMKKNQQERERVEIEYNRRINEWNNKVASHGGYPNTQDEFELAQIQKWHNEEKTRLGITNPTPEKQKNKEASTRTDPDVEAKGNITTNDVTTAGNDIYSGLSDYFAQRLRDKEDAPGAQNLRNQAALHDKQAADEQANEQQNRQIANRDYRGEAEKNAVAGAATENAQKVVNLGNVSAGAAALARGVKSADYNTHMNRQDEQREKAVEKQREAYGAQQTAEGERQAAEAENNDKRNMDIYNSLSRYLSMGGNQSVGSNEQPEATTGGEQSTGGEQPVTNTQPEQSDTSTEPEDKPENNEQAHIDKVGDEQQMNNDNTPPVVSTYVPTPGGQKAPESTPQPTPEPTPGEQKAPVTTPQPTPEPTPQPTPEPTPQPTTQDVHNSFKFDTSSIPQEWLDDFTNTYDKLPQQIKENVDSLPADQQYAFLAIMSKHGNDNDARLFGDRTDKQLESIGFGPQSRKYILGINEDNTVPEQPSNVSVMPKKDKTDFKERQIENMSPDNGNRLEHAGKIAYSYPVYKTKAYTNDSKLNSIAKEIQQLNTFIDSGVNMGTITKQEFPKDVYNKLTSLTKQFEDRWNELSLDSSLLNSVYAPDSNSNYSGSIGINPANGFWPSLLFNTLGTALSDARQKNIISALSDIRF